MLEALQHDELPLLHLVARHLIADRSFDGAPRGAHGLEILVVRGGKKGSHRARGVAGSYLRLGCDGRRGCRRSGNTPMTGRDQHQRRHYFLHANLRVKQETIMIHQRLYINVDHVATVRQARRGQSPDPVAAAKVCEQAGADGITAHLREDRRHIQDRDIEALAKTVTTVLNLEMACTDEMVTMALRLKPHQVTLVPERREEVTTEGGLDVSRDRQRLAGAIERLNDGGIRTSLFIDADVSAVKASHELGAAAEELHTGAYSHQPQDPKRLAALREATELGAKLGLAV